MNDPRRRTGILLIIAAIVVLMGVVDLATRPRGGGAGKSDKSAETSKKTSDRSAGAALQLLREKAVELQATGNWCDAAAAWKQLLAAMPNEANEELASVRQEAEHNSRRTDQLCQTKQVPAKGEPVPVTPPKENPPAPISADNLKEWYPKGKAVRSVGLLHISGRGTNKRWVFQAESHFQYVYRIATETTVVKNDDGSDMLVFEQAFHDVSQSRAVSRKTLEFSPPDSLLVNVGWGEFERQVLKLNPAYVVVRKLVAQLDKIDSNAKRTLTWFQDALRQQGVEINTSDEIEYVTSIERLAGTKVRIEYVNGLGVVGITRLDGLELTQDELTQLAHASTMMMDYYLFPAANKKEGESWEVKATDVAQMVMPIAFDTVVDGAMTIKRLKDTSADIATLQPLRGDLLLRHNSLNQTQQGRLSIKSGTAQFSKTDHIVRSARLAFDADIDVQGRPDFLLFGTKAMRDLQVDSRYEAEVVQPKGSGQ